MHIASFIKGYRRDAVLAPLFKLSEAVLELFVPIVVASLIDRGIGGNDPGYIVRMALLLVLLGVTGLLVSVTAQYFAARAATGFAEKMKSALYAHIASLSEIDRDRLGTNTLITRLTSDSVLVQNGINMFLRLFLRSPFVVIGAAIAAFTVDSHLSWIFVVVIPVLSVIVAAIMSFTIPMYRKVQGALDSILSRTRENLTGVRVLRAFGKEEDEERRFNGDLASLNDLQLRSGRVSALLNPLTYVVINLAIIALIYGGRERYEASLIEIGAIVALVNYMNQILVELVKFANLIVTMTRAIASGRRIEAIFTIQPSMSDAEDGAEKGLDTEDAISFSSVSLTYREGGEPSLSDITVTIRKGEKIGIIGGTGSGKTSLINLIPRFYDVTEGSVSVFGIDVRKWKRSALRSVIAYVPQKTRLFSGTIRSNLLWGRKDADEAMMMKALEESDALSFVLDKDGQLDSRVSAGGKNLSGGQRQRLAIARALVKDAPILILDDSFSALDFKTESKVRHSVLSGERTVLLVSQRTGAMMSMDRVIVMDKGRIAGIGSHDELLSSCPIYREIYSSQYGGIDESIS